MTLRHKSLKIGRSQLSWKEWQWNYSVLSIGQIWKSIALRVENRTLFWCSGVFAKLQKATVSFVMPVCPSVCVEQLGSQWMNFHGLSYLRIFRIYVKKIHVSLKDDKGNT